MPSKRTSGGEGTRQASRIVGVTSMWAASWSHCLPAANRAGQCSHSGERIPPSCTSLFMPRRSPT